MPYVVSTQAAIWNKDKLLQYLDSSESAWDFEINGSKKAKTKNDKFYCVNDNLFNYLHHSVEKGKWFPREIKRLNNIGISPDVSSRKVMSNYEIIIWYFKKAIGYFKLKFY